MNERNTKATTIATSASVAISTKSRREYRYTRWASCPGSTPVTHVWTDAWLAKWPAYPLASATVSCGAVPGDV